MLLIYVLVANLDFIMFSPMEDVYHALTIVNNAQVPIIVRPVLQHIICKIINA